MKPSRLFIGCVCMLIAAWLQYMVGNPETSGALFSGAAVLAWIGWAAS